MCLRPLGWTSSGAETGQAGGLRGATPACPSRTWATPAFLILKGQALPDSRGLECAALCAWNLRPPNPGASIHTPSLPSSFHLGNHLLREPREGKAPSHHSTFPLVSGSLGFNRLFFWAFTQVPWRQRSLSSVLTNAWHAQEIFVD